MESFNMVDSMRMAAAAAGNTRMVVVVVHRTSKVVAAAGNRHTAVVHRTVDTCDAVAAAAAVEVGAYNA